MKGKQRNSQTTPLTIGNNRSVSNSSHDETLIGSPAQPSESSPASPASFKGEAGSNSPSSPSENAATELVDTETDEAREAERYWIEKDEERLVVIANMEKAMAETKGELASTVTAFQMASDANYKLQAELERKTRSLSQVEEDINEVVHDLNAADMNNEELKKDLAHSRRDRQHQFDRAEEAMTLIEADPSKKTIAEILQAKAEAESRDISKQREMESEIETLNSQLKERCSSVALLTQSLSRVADSDRWVEVKKELNDLKERADRLPEDLQAALRECDEWKGEYNALQASQEEELKNVHDASLKDMREVRRQLKEKAAKSERALRECLKQVFERMVRCTLCLENQGFSPFDRKHFAICKQVVKLLGEDYQQPLLDYYEEHDIQEDFSWIEDDNEDEDEDGHERVYYVNSDIQARHGEPGRQGNNQEQNEGSIGNHRSVDSVDLHSINFSSRPSEITHDSSSIPTSATMEVDNVANTMAEGEEIQDSPQTWENRGKLEAAHSVNPTANSPATADQAIQAVAVPSIVVKDAGAIASSDLVHAAEADIVSSSETADETGDRHLPIEEGSVQAAGIADVRFSSSDEVDAHNESKDVKETVLDPDNSETGAVVLEDKPRTDLKPKKQARASHEIPVPAPAPEATTKLGSNNGFTFSRPTFTSEQAEAINLPTAAGGNSSDTGRTSAFVFGNISPPPFSATPVANSKEGSMSPGPSRNPKSKEATSPSNADKGSSQNIWGRTSFASAEKKPIFQAVPAGVLEAKSNEAFPTLNSSVTSNPAQSTTPASENPEAKQANGATKAQAEVVSSTTEKANIFPQPGIFNFGGINGPVSFTASSPSFLARATQPTSTGGFSVEGHDSWIATVQPKEHAGEDGIAKGESPKEDESKIEAPKKKVPEETSSEEEAQKEELPDLEASPQVENSSGKRLKKEMSREESMSEESPTASNLSRKERKAAKKAQDKAAQKALNEARNAKAQESRRVEKAMMMK